MAFLDVAGKTYQDLVSRHDLIQMGHNCNLLEIHPAIHEAMINAIKHDDYRVYVPPSGFEELIELISHDVGISGARVLVTQGATEAIYQALCVMLKPGDELVVTDPAWPHIANIARSLGATVTSVPVYSDEARYKLLPDLLSEHLSTRTKVIAVIDPFNPLGSTYSKTEIEQICRLAGRNGAYVLHDATYRDFAPDHYSALKAYDRAAMAVSLSKCCGFAGLRVGAVITSNQLLDRILENQVARLGGNWIAQKGAIAAYRTKPEWLPRVRTINERNKNQIAKAVESIAGLRCVVFPNGGNFVALDVQGLGCTSEDLVSAILDLGVVVRSGNYTSTRFGDAFLRVTTTVPPDQVDRFVEILPQAASIACAVRS